VSSSAGAEEAIRITLSWVELDGMGLARAHFGHHSDSFGEIGLR